MERLTNKHEADQQRRNYEKRLEQGYPRNIPEERFLRLAAYEDTGLSPKVCGEYKKFEDEAIGKNVTFNRIVELMNADAAGRLVVLPCKELFEKIGDDVYVIDDGEVVEALLCLVGFDHTGTDCIEAVYGKSQEDEQWYTLRFADVGKTVFLTREEAEAALAGERKDGEG